jgi:hypothetical protein
LMRAAANQDEKAEYQEIEPGGMSDHHIRIYFSHLRFSDYKYCGNHGNRPRQWIKWTSLRQSDSGELNMNVRK